MNTREQFGSYLLLKKLGEDPLGEAFRAGKVGGQGMEEVVLLRVFNGPGLDGPGMWKQIEGRQGVQKALTSPNIGSGVDLGAIRNIPYVAYDYLSGKNLFNLLEQASKRKHPIPSDHALLITERIALGLAVGYETRYEAGRILHGCVVPNLVMISNEGETRLLGFEVAPGLRQAILQNPSHTLGRYLSPEARAGQPIDKADDVFSLGVILLELLSGRPAPAGGDYGALINAAQMQPEGNPIPDALKQLMARSLAPRDQRIGDVIQWHKTLSKMMFDGQYNPTTFNLAFYMHNLFRDEIEKESKEIEVERTMEIPVTAIPVASTAAPAPAGATAATGGDLRETTGVREDTSVIMDRYADDGEKSGPNKMVLGIAAAVLMVAIGAGAYMMSRGSDESPIEPATAETTAPEPVAEPAGPTPEELEAQQQAEKERAAAEQAALEERIAAIVDEKDQERMAELEKLKADLAQAQQREQEAERERQRLAEAAAAQAAAEQAAAEQAAAEQAAAEQAAAEQAAAEQAAAEAEAAKEQEVAQVAPKPKEPEVRTGDLVTLGPGVVAPKFITMRPVTYPAMARRLRKESTVTVSCLVDENGNVKEAKLKGREVGFGMDSEALAAAKTARFNPATKNGVRVKIWWDLPIKFTL